MDAYIIFIRSVPGDEWHHGNLESGIKSCVVSIQCEIK